MLSSDELEEVCFANGRRRGRRIVKLNLKPRWLFLELSNPELDGFLLIFMEHILWINL